MERRVWDISPLIDERLQVWPGDTPPAREVLLELYPGTERFLGSWG